MIRRSLAAVGFSLLPVAAASAAPIVIDDFSQGSFSLATAVSDERVEAIEPGLNEDHVLGGVRQSSLRETASQTPATATLPPVGNGILLTAGADSSTWFTLTYSGSNDGTPSLGVDLTDGGTNDRFAVTISGLPDDQGVGATFYLVDTEENLYWPDGRLMTGPGTHVLRFDELRGASQLDFTSIERVGILFRVVSTDPVSVTINDVRVVPEPSGVALVGLGALLVSRRRR